MRGTRLRQGPTAADSGIYVVRSWFSAYRIVSSIGNRALISRGDGYDSTFGLPQILNMTCDKEFLIICRLRADSTTSRVSISNADLVTMRIPDHKLCYVSEARPIRTKEYTCILLSHSSYFIIAPLVSYPVCKSLPFCLGEPKDISSQVPNSSVPSM